MIPFNELNICFDMIKFWGQDSGGTDDSQLEGPGLEALKLEPFCGEFACANSLNGDSKLVVGLNVSVNVCHMLAM